VGLSTLNFGGWSEEHFAKVMLLSFNGTDIFLYDVIVSENDLLEAR